MKGIDGEAIGGILTVLGLILFVGGIILGFGNITGWFPTFSYAGFLSMTVGGILLRVFTS